MLEKLREAFSKKKNVVVGAIIIAMFVLAAFVITRVRHPLREPKPYDTGGVNITSAPDAQTTALKLAQGWHTDALLSSLSSERAHPGDPINTWKLIFISPSAPKKGFLVIVSVTKIESAEEINYGGVSGAQFPDEASIISQGEAIERIHRIKGYENEPILGIEAVYDPIKHSWFWAAKTARGTVSVDASK